MKEVRLSTQQIVVRATTDNGHMTSPIRQAGDSSGTLLSGQHHATGKSVFGLCPLHCADWWTALALSCALVGVAVAISQASE